MSLISPRTPPGVMELLPREQVAFQTMLDTIRAGFERFGFLPIETPVFETVEVLLTKSGGDTEKQVYFVQSTGNRQQGRDPDLALRFDLTVPLARYVAEHEKHLAFPFRRYQIQRVYRGERAQKGRYREFYQCDIDVIGKDSLPLLYDAEMPAVIHTIFEALRIGDFTISINNRKLLVGLLEGLGVPEPTRQALVLREVDKLDKVPAADVAAALSQPDIGLSADTAARLLDAVALAGTNQDVLAGLRRIGPDTPRFLEGLDDLERVAAGILAFGVPERRLRLNPAIARGLDYYTGTVYETHLDARPGLGSICSGGRYDNLASHYTRSRLPGVGISIGATRLFSQLLDAGLVRTEVVGRRVLVTQVEPTLFDAYVGLARRLRDAGIDTDLYVEAAKLAKQFKYADRAGFAFAVVMGGTEQQRGTVLIKDLAAGRQEEVPAEECPTRLKSLLEQRSD